MPSAVAELETSSESIVFLSLPSSHDIKTSNEKENNNFFISYKDKEFMIEKTKKGLIYKDFLLKLLKKTLVLLATYLF